MKVPQKRKGDPLRAAEVNEMARGARAGAGLSAGLNLYSTQLADAKHFLANPEHHQHTFQITNLKAFEDDTETSGLYLGRMLFYDADDEEWDVRAEQSVGGDDSEQIIDANSIGVILNVGDRVVCYFDSQRRAYVPIGGPGAGGGSQAYFQTVSTWQWPVGSGQYADCYMMLWDAVSNSYKVDTSRTFRVWSPIVEQWDPIYNGTPSSTPRTIFDFVLGYFDTISQRWQVSYSNQNNRRLAKCSSDWSVDGTDAVVQVQICDPDSKAVISSTANKAIIHRNWDATYLTAPAPAVWQDDFVWVDVDLGGNVTVASAVAFHYLKQVITYRGSATNIPTGFKLLDGTNYPAGSKIGTGASPDMKKRFIMGIDAGSAEASENAIGGTGGEETQNHRHELDSTTYVTAGVAAGTDETVITNDDVPYTSGLEELAVPQGNFEENRPPWYVFALIERYK